MSRSRRRLVAALPAAAVLAFAGPAAVVAPAAAAPVCTGADADPAAVPVAQLRATTLCLINRERTERGLHALDEHRRLDRSATRYSRAMARRDFFSHVSPGGSTMLARIRRAGYLSGVRGYTVGENLAWGAGSLATPAQTVRGWMNSPGHRANILSGRFRELGVGVAVGAPVRGLGRGATYTQNFGRRS